MVAFPSPRARVLWALCEAAVRRTKSHESALGSVLGMVKEVEIAGFSNDRTPARELMSQGADNLQESVSLSAFKL